MFRPPYLECPPSHSSYSLVPHLAIIMFIYILYKSFLYYSVNSTKLTESVCSPLYF